MPDVSFDVTIERESGRTHALRVDALFDDPREPPLMDVTVVRGARERHITAYRLRESSLLVQAAEDELRSTADAHRADRR